MVSPNKNIKPSDLTDVIKNNINALLDDIISDSQQSVQPDSYYTGKYSEMRALSENCFSLISKRFQKANARERELILGFLKHYHGVDHINYFQDFVGRETFWPCTGMLILEMFNKSDVIIDSSLVGKILDYDAFAQKVMQAIESGDLTGELLDDFLAKNKNERNGLVQQLLEQTGTKFSSFTTAIYKKDEKFGLDLLKYIAQVPDERAFHILESILPLTKSKEIKKLIKKIAHALKQKGIDVVVPDMTVKKSAVYTIAGLPDARAFVSTIDSAGYRLLFMLKPITTYEIKVFNIILNDGVGIHDIEVINSFRKESKTFIEKLQTDPKTEILEIKPEYGAFLVDEAVRLSERSGKVVSANILQWRNCFQDLQGKCSIPLIYDFYKEGDLDSVNNLDDRITELFQGTDIIFWFITSTDARDDWAQMDEVLSSKIVLNPVQKQERILEIQRQSVINFFDEDRRKVYKRRLEEIAYFFHMRGDTDKAQIALHAGSSLVTPEINVANNHFCKAIVREGFSYLEKTYRRAQEQASSSGDNKDISLTA